MTLMARTFGPSRVDEEIMNVLLRVLDDPLDVVVGLIDDFPQAVGVLYNQMVVFSSNCGVEVVKKQADNSFLVCIGHGHLFNVCPSAVSMLST